MSRSSCSTRSFVTPSKVTTRASAITASLSIAATLTPRRRFLIVRASSATAQRAPIADAALDPLAERPLGAQVLRVHAEPAVHRPPAHLERLRVGRGEQLLGLVRVDAHERTALTARRDRHVPAGEEREPAEHLLLDDVR